MFSLDSLLNLLENYKYLAMFGVLLACGLGLPLPEEVTLIASGLAVGWETANFWFASLSCVLGILAGDAFIFAMGRYHGRRFLQSRPMRILLNEKRQAKIDSLFKRRGSMAVFIARFFAGLRIGVYAYAGQHGMGWFRFLILDFLGALVSGPTSIWVGAYAARKLADPQQAVAEAKRMLHEGSYVIYAIIGIVVLVSLGHWWWSHRVDRRDRKPPDATPPQEQSGPPGAASAERELEVVARQSTRDPVAPRGEAPR